MIPYFFTCMAYTALLVFSDLRIPFITARAEPVLLKATVKQDMPCLKLHMFRRPAEAAESGGDPMLEGQIILWNLRLSNVGTAPATNVCLKTNLSWMDIQSASESIVNKENISSSKIAVLEKDAKSHCVGPTGTLMKLPIQGSHLRQQGSIHPGESIDIAIQMKAGARGYQDFYMLYRYELEDPSSRLKTAPHRWLKKMYKIPIYPSLSVSYSILPSSWNKSEHIVALEVRFFSVSIFIFRGWFLTAVYLFPRR